MIEYNISTIIFLLIVFWIVLDKTYGRRWGDGKI